MKYEPRLRDDKRLILRKTKLRLPNGRLYKNAASIIRTTLTAELTLAEARRREHIAKRLEAL